MNRTIYQIQIKSVRGAVEHLRLIDLSELQHGAAIHGTDTDRALITALLACLPHLPPDHA